MSVDRELPTCAVVFRALKSRDLLHRNRLDSLTLVRARLQQYRESAGCKVGSHDMGRRRDHDLRHGVRSFAADDYIVVHRVVDDGVVLIRQIVDGGRDLAALMGGLMETGSSTFCAGFRGWAAASRVPHLLYTAMSSSWLPFSISGRCFWMRICQTSTDRVPPAPLFFRKSTTRPS